MPESRWGQDLWYKDCTSDLQKKPEVKFRARHNNDRMEKSHQHLYWGIAHKLTEPFLAKESDRPLQNQPLWGLSQAGCVVSTLTLQPNVPTEVHLRRWEQGVRARCLCLHPPLLPQAGLRPRAVNGGEVVQQRDEGSS